MRAMNKRILAVLMTILICMGGVCASAEGTDGVRSILRLYGASLPDDALALMMQGFEPVTQEVGGAVVTLRELFTDGQWVYASVEAVPKDPATHLIMPGFGDSTDRVSGWYEELMTMDDDRSFAQAAQEDGKRLLRVSAYLEYEPMGDFMLDYFRKDDTAVIVMGGDVVVETEAFDLQWRVICTEMTPEGEDIEDGRQDASWPVSIPVHGTLETEVYPIGQAVGEDGAVLEQLTLIRTPLCVYGQAVWSEEPEEGIRNELQLLDAQGEEIPEGFSAAGDTWSMDALENAKQLRVVDYAGSDVVTLATFDLIPAP